MSRIVLVLVMLTAAGAAAQPWCWDADEIVAVAREGGVQVDHRAAFYNCCPDPVVYDLVVAGDVLELTETTLEESPCDCYCCFDLRVFVANVPAGDWTLRFAWLDMETFVWTSVDVPVTVPPTAVDGEPGVESHERSECIQSTGIAPPRGPSWGSVKARFR